MIDVRFQPISTWPRERRASHARNGSPFKAGYPDTLDKLEREIEKLAGKDIVIEAGFARADLRNDGWPRAGVRPSDPGVIVNFQSKYGPLRLPCDYFEDWTANLRAIALHLERLRLASLYGVGDYGEQYKGWLRLGAGEPGSTVAAAGAMTVERASRVLASICLRIDEEKLPKMDPPRREQVENYRSIYRKAASIAHPEATGSDGSKWELLQRAREVLDLFHGIAKNQGGAE